MKIDGLRSGDLDGQACNMISLGPNPELVTLRLILIECSFKRINSICSGIYSWKDKQKCAFKFNGEPPSAAEGLVTNGRNDSLIWAAWFPF